MAIAVSPSNQQTLARTKAHEAQVQVDHSSRAESAEKHKEGQGESGQRSANINNILIYR